MRIAIDWLVDKGLNANHNKGNNVISFLGSYSTAYIAPVCIVMAPVGALGGTRGHEVAQ